MTLTLPHTSDWPLSAGALRVLMPPALVAEMAKECLSNACYPLAVGYYPSAAGHRIARAQPEDWLVIYCIDGTAEVTFDDSQQRVSAGDLLLLPAHLAHHYRADADQPWSLYWMHLAGTQMAPWFARLHAVHGAVKHPGIHEKLIADFRALLMLASADTTLDAGVHAASLCQNLLSFAALLCARQQQPSDGLDIDALHGFMQQRLEQRLTLEQLADAAQQSSRYQFIRQYKQRTGQTPMQAFLQMKVSRACYLLEISDDSVAEIAQQFGFEDPYYFSRLFKKIVGVAPSKYRSQGQSHRPTTP